MARSIASPILSKTHARLKISKGARKPRSSINEGLFRRDGRIVETSGLKRTVLFNMSPKVNRSISKSSSRHHVPSRFRDHRRREGENSAELYLAPKETQGFSRFELEDDDNSSRSCSTLGESEEIEKHNWLDGSTLIAQYQDAESETEEERALALVDYLQVPLQEKYHELKRDLCNSLLATIKDIRQAHIKIDREVDADRGTGIVHFNDACDKRHIDASRVQAELKDGMTDNQVEIKNLFVQLKQAYDDRKQLWVDLQAHIDEITGLQAAVLDQLDDNMARAVATLDKRGKAILKDDVSRDKDKLLRGVLGKL